MWLASVPGPLWGVTLLGVLVGVLLLLQALIQACIDHSTNPQHHLIMLVIPVAGTGRAVVRQVQLQLWALVDPRAKGARVTQAKIEQQRKHQRYLTPVHARAASFPFWRAITPNLPGLPGEGAALASCGRNLVNQVCTHF